MRNVKKSSVTFLNTDGTIAGFCGIIEICNDEHEPEPEPDIDDSLKKFQIELEKFIS